MILFVNFPNRLPQGKRFFLDTMLSKIKLGFIILFGLLQVWGCKNNKSNHPIQKSSINSLYEVDTRLKDIDSAVLVFYKDPYGEDSTRYTRYYTQASIRDPLRIPALDEQLNEPSIKEDKRNCRGEGKIWCYSKGKILQTIYFSTRCTDCCFLYLIRDGNFYYSKITPSFTNWLKDQKSKTI